MRDVPKAGAVLLSLTLSMTSALRADAYTKPGTLKISAPSAFLFPEQYPISPHTWTILRAVDLLRDDGFVSEADMAQKDLLPMMLGATPDSLEEDVAQLAPRHARPLLATLEVAERARHRGACGLAALLYRAFIDEVRASSPWHIDKTAAQILGGDAAYLIAHCP